MKLATGTRVTPNVELLRPLGSGGMGSVWVAQHHGLDVEVAVKFVSSEAAGGDEATTSRFKREAALSAKIKSPHVVKTFDFGLTDDGVPFIVMELLSGESLGGRLAREGKLLPRDVAVIVAQTAQVLEEAHALGVVHRDIKPDNLFLIEAGYELFVKVLDFGIAKQTAKLGVASVTDTGAILGTPEYMSPEQLLSPKSADWRADMWALAVVAYRALTGVTPFTGETLPSLSLAICNATYQAPSTLYDGLPEGTDAWFARAFEPKRERRFESVTAMAQALTSLFRDSTVVPVSVEQADTQRPRAGEGEGGTLASAPSEAASALHLRAGEPVVPVIGVEEAADDPDAVTKTADGGPGFADDGRSESSRRRGPVVIELARPRSTRSQRFVEREVPSTMRFDEHSDKRVGRLKLVGALLAGLLCVATADLLLRGSGELGLTDPKAPASARAPESAADLWREDRVVIPPPPRADPDGAASADEPHTSPADPNAADGADASEPTPTPPRPAPVAARPTPPPPPAPPEPSAVEDPCESPYIVLANGTLKVKPECVKR